MSRPCQKFANPKVHDLLQLDCGLFGLDGMAAPDWAKETLTACPWVVVRRAQAPDAQVAVGVRGTLRSERWGWSIRKDMICKIVRPWQLLGVVRSSALSPRTPPLAALKQLIERWRDLSLPWGPTGSLGFELATGCPVTNSLSDLDIAIRSEERIPLEQARSLSERSLGLQTKVDIRVETPECSFSLEEYVFSSSTILLRYSDGTRFGNDPWAKNPQPVLGTL